MTQFLLPKSKCWTTTNPDLAAVFFPFIIIIIPFAS